MIQLNEISELRQHLDANRGKPLTIGLPQRVELDKPLNITHDADITLMSVQGTEIQGEQLSVTTPGILTYSNLAHMGFQHLTGAQVDDFWNGHTNLEAINGRGLSGAAKEIHYRNCTILKYMDDGYGGTADRIVMVGCLVGRNIGTGQGGLVTNAREVQLLQNVFVDCDYRLPIKLDNVDSILMDRNVIVWNRYHMEATCRNWEVSNNWFRPHPMGLARTICPSGPGTVLCYGNLLHGKRVTFSKLFGNLRGDLDEKNRASVTAAAQETLAESDMTPALGRAIVHSAGANVQNEGTILAKRMAIELGMLKAAKETRHAKH